MDIKFVLLLAFAVSATWGAKLPHKDAKKEMTWDDADEICLKEDLKRDPECREGGTMYYCTDFGDGVFEWHGGDMCRTIEHLQCEYKLMGRKRPVLAEDIEKCGEVKR